METRLINQVYSRGITSRDSRFGQEYRKVEYADQLRKQSALRQKQLHAVRRQEARTHASQTGAAFNSAWNADMERFALGARYTPLGTLMALYEHQTATLMSMVA